MTDQTYRPVPTFADRLAQDDRDQLDARAATAEQERDDALDDLTETRRKLAMVIAERDERLTLAESSRLAKRYDEAEEARDCARQVATFRQGVIDQYRQELGAAGEVLAVVRDAQEQIERALARYDTQPEVTPVEPEHYAYPDGTCAPDCPGCSTEPGVTPVEADEAALEHADSALIDRDDSVWRPGDGAYWTTRYLDPMTRDEIEAQFGPTRAVLLIDIEHDNEQDDTEAEAGLGSVSPHAQDDEDEATAPRRLLDQAITAALPVAGGRVADLLAALRAALAEVDAKRAAVNELRQG